MILGEGRIYLQPFEYAEARALHLELVIRNTISE